MIRSFLRTSESDPQMPTVSVKGAAALAGVSIGTASNVLNRPAKISLAAAARVHAAVEKLGFIRNDAARQLRISHSHAIGPIILDVGNPLFTDVARSAENRSAEASFTVILGNSGERADREYGYLLL